MVKALGEHWVTLFDTTIKVETAVYSLDALVGTAQEKNISFNVTKTSTPGNLSVQIQGSIDGSTWFDIGDALSFSATGTDYAAWTVHSPLARVKFTSAATTDSSKYWTVTAKLSGK